MTTKMTHTPGPWECPGTDGDEWAICHRDRTRKRRTIAHVYYEANARLIAAAPDLLAALRRYVQYEDEKHPFSVRQAARTALAKAEGRTP